MSASISATSSSSSSTKIAFLPTTQHSYSNTLQKLCFPLSSKPRFRLFFSKPLPSRMVAVKARLNKVAVEGSNNAPAKSGLPTKEIKMDEPSKGTSVTQVASEESISEFISQVSDLVKLVDSRDIVELQLKQFDCEILIRKKLAVETTLPSHVPYVTGMQSPPPMMAPPASSPAPPPTAVPAPAAAKSPPKSSVPPLLSPMAGTFYRCPGPGEPPFVKVGDKVQKGQVLCIIEAMKLMNEIQAEQSGTVVEVVAEDGKPVSKDSPLFAIQP